jgi:hypothetical protein
MKEKAKMPSLLEQLQSLSGKAANPEPQEGEPGYFVAPSRRGKKAVTIWVDPAVADQLKEIAFLHRKPQQALFLEALNILFAKYGRPEIA